MPDIDDELARGAIGEEILAQIKLVLEVVSAQPTRTEFNDLKDDVAELKQDLRIVKAAVTDLSTESRGHEARLTDLGSTVERHERLLPPLKRRAA